MTKVLYVEHNDDNLYMLKTRLELRGDFDHAPETPFLRSFGVVWRQLQVRLLTPKALMYLRPSIFG